MKTHYSVLDLNSSATQDEIKESYRLHAAAWHPDRHIGANRQRAEDKMKEINEAYQVLSNTQRRIEYDKLLIVKDRPQPVAQNQPNSSGEFIQVPGSAIHLPVNVYNEAAHFALSGQTAMASQVILRYKPDINTASLYEIVTSLAAHKRRK